MKAEKKILACSSTSIKNKTITAFATSSGFDRAIAILYTVDEYKADIVIKINSRPNVKNLILYWVNR